MIKKLNSTSKDTWVAWGLGFFIAVTFILKTVHIYFNPLIPDLPYDTLSDGGVIVTILYYVIYKIPNQINNLEDKLEKQIRDLGEQMEDQINTLEKNMEKNLLGSLLDSYSDFKEELRTRLTETE